MEASPVSGGEPLLRPRSPAPAVADPVVKPVGAALPEFDAIGPQPVSPPARRPGDGDALEPPGRPPQPLLQIRAPGDRPALRRSPRAEPRSARPRPEVVVRFLLRDRLDPPLDAHLPP